MLIQRSAKRDNDQSKVYTMFEYMVQSELDTVPSPRILNTHFTPKLVYSIFPDGLVESLINGMIFRHIDIIVQYYDENNETRIMCVCDDNRCLRGIRSIFAS